MNEPLRLVEEKFFFFFPPSWLTQRHRAKISLCTSAQSTSVRPAVFDACALLLALLVDLHMSMQGGGVPPTVHILVHLLGNLLRVAKVRRGHSHLHHDHYVVHFDGWQGAVVKHITHIISNGGGNRVVDLPFIQWYDQCAVVKLGLAYHCLGELHLGCDVGHRYGVVVIIGDVQSVCDVEIDNSFVLVIGDVGSLHSHIGDINRARE